MSCEEIDSGEDRVSARGVAEGMCYGSTRDSKQNPTWGLEQDVGVCSEKRVWNLGRCGIVITSPGFVEGLVRGRSSLRITSFHPGQGQYQNGLSTGRD